MSSGDEPEVELEAEGEFIQRPGLQTRRSNTLKHPGRVVTDQIKHRRTHSQVLADRAAAEKAKAEAAEERRRRLRNVALIQYQLEQEMAVDKVRTEFGDSFI